MLNQASFKGYAFLHANLYDLGPYPAIGPGHGKVYGEIYEVNEQTLSILDQIEGFNRHDLPNSLYHREQGGYARLMTANPSKLLPMCITAI